MPTYVVENCSQIHVLDHGYVRLLSHHGSDREIARHARTSTGKEGKSEADDKKLIFYLYRNRHTSPFEMAKVWLEVACPIFVFRQWVRHRTMNVNEVSARYSEMPNMFYIPSVWRKEDKKNKQSSIVDLAFNPILPGKFRGNPHNNNASDELNHHCMRAYRLYERLLSNGIAREMARMVLPVNLYTKVHLCVDLHNLLGFLRLRDDAHAQAEIQEYGRAIKTLITPLFPWTMEAYRRFPLVVLDTETQKVTDL